MMKSVVPNYTERGGAKTVIGGTLEFKEGAKLTGGLMPNQEYNSAGTTATLKADLNALLLKLKNAGLMVGDAFTLTVTKSINDTVAGHANRQYNTEQISSVAESDGVITITLSKKVSALKDFDGGNGWGTHKWLGIGVSAGISDLTDLKYNGSALTADDITEATGVGLSSGYFVRWVAADLVLVGDNTQKSVDHFKLWADGYDETEYKLKIVEPE